MTKAYEIMTKSLATCQPDDNAAYVASVMRDRDIGNVLVVEDGTLKGIVTDRDLAVRALSDDSDLKNAPISKYMTKDIVTGRSDWNLNKIANTMAKHQIRRLPIVDEGQVAGIISLGDIARHHNRIDVVSNSLKDISEPDGLFSLGGNGMFKNLMRLSFLVLASGFMAWLTMSQNGRQFRKQVMHSKTYASANQAVNMAMNRVNDVATSKAARDLRRNISRQVKPYIKDITEQLPTITYKPPKRRSMWFS